MKKSLLALAVVAMGMIASGVASAHGPPSVLDSHIVAQVSIPSIGGGPGDVLASGKSPGIVAMHGGSGGISSLPDGDGISSAHPNERMLN